jgi:hypothetical protein
VEGNVLEEFRGGEKEQKYPECRLIIEGKSSRGAIYYGETNLICFILLQKY